MHPFPSHWAPGRSRDWFELRQQALAGVMRQEARGLGPTITYQLQKLGQLALNVWMDLVWKVEVQDSGVL